MSENNEIPPKLPCFDWDTYVCLPVTPKASTEGLDTSSVFMSPTITPTSVEKTPAANRAGTSQQEGDRSDSDEDGETDSEVQMPQTPVVTDVEMDASPSEQPEEDREERRLIPNTRKRVNEDRKNTKKHICKLEETDPDAKLLRDELEKRLSMAPRKRNCRIWNDAPAEKYGRGFDFVCADCPRCLMIFGRVTPKDARPVHRRLHF